MYTEHMSARNMKAQARTQQGLRMVLMAFLDVPAPQLLESKGWFSVAGDSNRSRLP